MHNPSKVTSPMAQPRRPRLALPAGSCDSHVHVYGPASRFPFDPHRPYTPEDAPVEQLEALHRWLGLERAVYVQATVHGFDNAAILDAIARNPSQARGIALVHTDISGAALQNLHAAGVRGVRFNFIKHLGDAPDPQAVLRLAERIGAMGWHVQLHFGAQDLLDQLPLLHRLQCPFAIDHMGRTPVAGGLAQEACIALLDVLADPRAWIKLSGPERISATLAHGGAFPYADVVPFARQLLAAAPDRTVWGTDWPHPNVREMPDDGDLVDLLAHYGDVAMLDGVLVRNPARLYGFD
ncbi:putative TIM-barrel fold metal-dependent hydrolase [Comamonas sp. BIGb0124]|uniref:amidohydrolase family protein n=1 Tax=Comamonas sp. BIGb0124 TaxID=2485130 RepID=UPI000FAB5B62|nr:amidohydrolase family protein [Comamonas sp. BIGb0124]ROR18363.1 putative TIM-barrel fold metal-dependent hydrolase [Comamonas sp. BIGb0124]